MFAKRMVLRPTLCSGFLSLVIALVAACESKEHYVIASTGTLIGVEVMQNPINQTPQAKLGYNRAELAIVPSNRGICTKDNSGRFVCTESHLGGAKDTTEVLMELRYGGIFSLGDDSGIYQRLAVGKTAVQQPGASLMFARNTAGKIDANAVNALNAVKSVPATPEDVKTASRPIVAKFREFESAEDAESLGKFETAAKEIGYDSYSDFITDDNLTVETIENFKNALRNQGVELPVS